MRCRSVGDGSPKNSLKNSAIISRRRRAARVWFGFRKRGLFFCLVAFSVGVFTASACVFVGAVKMPQNCTLSMWALNSGRAEGG